MNCNWLNITVNEKCRRCLCCREKGRLRLQWSVMRMCWWLRLDALMFCQLMQVIETFQLKISEDQLMSRCSKCNGRFIQKPLSTEEAVEAAKGFQKIPNCLFNKNIEFWQCMDCHQLYWEVQFIYSFFSLPFL